MNKPTRIEIDCTTGAQTVIELTDAEIAQREINQTQALADSLAREIALTAKAERRASAIIKLKALGLTEDEVTALI